MQHRSRGWLQGSLEGTASLGLGATWKTGRRGPGSPRAGKGEGQDVEAAGWEAPSGGGGGRPANLLRPRGWGRPPAREQTVQQGRSQGAGPVL